MKLVLDFSYPKLPKLFWLVLVMAARHFLAVAVVLVQMFMRSEQPEWAQELEVVEVLP